MWDGFCTRYFPRFSNVSCLYAQLESRSNSHGKVVLLLRYVLYMDPVVLWTTRKQLGLSGIVKLLIVSVKTVLNYNFMTGKDED